MGSTPFGSHTRLSVKKLKEIGQVLHHCTKLAVLDYCQLCVSTYFQFSSLIASTYVITCEISNQGVCEDYILRLNAKLV